MSADNFQRALALVLEHEGGYVHDPADPGGCTNYGITIGTYRAIIDPRGTCADVRRIDPATVARIYRHAYWDAIRGDDLPSGLDLAVFDVAVNSGPHRAAQFLQRELGVKDDGRISSATLAAAERDDPADLVAGLCDARLAWLRGLKLFARFGRGWTRRVQLTRKTALAWIAEKKTPERRR
jgi:lysozyme family protein